jgi:hypothetical protein
MPCAKHARELHKEKHLVEFGVEKMFVVMTRSMPKEADCTGIMDYDGFTGNLSRWLE